MYSITGTIHRFGRRWCLLSWDLVKSVPLTSLTCPLIVVVHMINDLHNIYGLVGGDVRFYYRKQVVAINMQYNF